MAIIIGHEHIIIIIKKKQTSYSFKMILIRLFVWENNKHYEHIIQINIEGI